MNSRNSSLTIKYYLYVMESLTNNLINIIHMIDWINKSISDTTCIWISRDANLWPNHKSITKLIGVYIMLYIQPDNYNVSPFKYQIFDSHPPPTNEFYRRHVVLRYALIYWIWFLNEGKLMIYDITFTIIYREKPIQSKPVNNHCRREFL